MCSSVSRVHRPIRACHGSIVQPEASCSASANPSVAHKERRSLHKLAPTTWQGSRSVLTGRGPSGARPTRASISSGHDTPTVQASFDLLQVTVATPSRLGAATVCMQCIAVRKLFGASEPNNTESELFWLRDEAAALGGHRAAKPSGDAATPSSLVWLCFAASALDVMSRALAVKDAVTELDAAAALLSSQLPPEPKVRTGSRRSVLSPGRASPSLHHRRCRLLSVEAT